MRLAALALLALLALVPAAAGQTADDAGTPVMGSSAKSDLEPSAEKQITQILVLGDAIGGGLGAGLIRASEASGAYEVSNRFNEESGLARPEVYDWAERLPKILESRAFGVVVVMLGTNDKQVIRDGAARIAFNTEEWARAYAAQVDRLLDELKASGARVIWVAPPPMRDPEYDAAVKTIAAIQKARVEEKGMTFLDLRAALSAPDGSYSDTGEDDTGTVTRLRGRDGVSFFKAGNNRMAQLVLAAIASGAAPGPVQAEEAAPVEVEKPSLIPVFGQLLMNGEVYTVAPEGVTANAVMLTSAGLDAEAALKALREIAPRGSAAERLFKRGEPAPPPTGRADDFAAPPAP